MPTVGNMDDGADGSDMTREDRRDFVLRFLAEHDLALPPKAIHRNLRHKHNATFGYSAMRNYLDDMVEDGLVTRIKPDELENREVTEMERGRNQRAYYILTDKGRERAAELK